MPAPPTAWADRFRAKIRRDRVTGCHIWTSSRDKDGYALFKVWDEGRSVTIRAARAAWELRRRRIRPGESVLHACDNPACVNVAHLRLGTDADNARDKQLRGRATGSNGHHADAETIWALKGRVSQGEIARQCGVSRRWVNHILNHRPLQRPLDARVT